MPLIGTVSGVNRNDLLEQATLQAQVYYGTDDVDVRLISEEASTEYEYTGSYAGRERRSMVTSYYAKYEADTIG